MPPLNRELFWHHFHDTILILQISILVCVISHSLITLQDTTEVTPPAIHCIPVPPVEYLLGIADLSGELMRMAIRSVSSGSLDDVYRLLNPIRHIYHSFVKFGSISRELPRKVTVLRQSMMKVEAACYTVQIRGSEFPKHMLADLLHDQPEGSGFHDEEDRVH